jgi:GTP diphosphokinase / guanosine-3',5'-bis(diphosphate) 3'-diphosphatase
METQRVPEIDLQTIENALRESTQSSRAMVDHAWYFAQSAHTDQKRLSGEPFFQHPAHVAHFLAMAGADTPTVVSALLHDTIEDAGISGEELEAHFGNEVRFIVEGVTKLGEIKYVGDEAYAEQLRRLFFAASGDVRVLLIKLYDRLHNMQTNHMHPQERAWRKAQETLHIYAPIAEQLGMGQVKRDLEDLAFPYVQPDDYEVTLRLREAVIAERESAAREVATILEHTLKAKGIAASRTSVYAKGLYRLHTKLQRTAGVIEQIDDVFSVRFVVNTPVDCYRALGVVHASMRAVPGRVRDYIAFPKTNGYQGIHTAIYCGVSTTEVQICTAEMDAHSQHGILITARNTVRWLSDVSDMCAALMTADPGELMKNIAQDFFGYRICVFTPQGEAIHLPADACAVDCAYAIHSVVGDHIAAVRINGRVVSPTTILQNGDIVDIATSASVQPDTDWLAHVKTTRAQLRIRESLCRTV